MVERNGEPPKTPAQEMADYAWCCLGDADGGNVTLPQIKFILKAEKEALDETRIRLGLRLESNPETLEGRTVLGELYWLNCIFDKTLVPRERFLSAAVILAGRQVEIEGDLNHLPEPEQRRLAGRIRACGNAISILHDLGGKTDVKFPFS